MITRLAPLFLCLALAAQERIVRVDLAYRAPESGSPVPNFSPYGTQVQLTDVPPDTALPEGAAQPAKTGTLQLGPRQVKILVTADRTHPLDLCRLYVDPMRPHIGAALSQNEKTKAWWSSINLVKIDVDYGDGVVEPYTVNFWSVREGDATPKIIRYSVASWRSGKVHIDGIDALVAVMDGNNDAIFNSRDTWSVLSAAEPDADRRVLSHTEARAMSRLMFVANPAGKELVLEFRGITADGRSLTMAVVDRPVTKSQDRAPDDTLAAERARPRTAKPFPWIDHDLARALAQAKETGRNVLIDFWASWCGPCHSLDEWIWSDAEVAEVLHAGYIGLKLDNDVEKDLVARFHVQGLPTLIVLDPTGKELRRFGYASSKEMVRLLR
jgi:thiol-disulfide isomerase/thioredoxin